MAPLAILNIAQLVPLYALWLGNVEGHITPEVESPGNRFEQLDLVAPVVGVGGRGALGGIHQVPQGVVGPGQNPHMKRTGSVNQ